MRRRYAQERQIEREAIYEGQPRTHEVYNTLKGGMEAWDEGSRSAAQPMWKAGNLPRGLVDFASGAANIPKALADFGWNKPWEHIERKEAERQGVPFKGATKAVELDSVPGFSDVSEALRDVAEEGATEQYEEKVGPWFRFAGEFADMALPAGAGRAALKVGKAGVAKAVTKISKATRWRGLGDDIFSSMASISDDAMAASKLTPEMLDVMDDIAFKNIGLEAPSVEELVKVDSAIPNAPSIMQPDTYGIHSSRSSVAFMNGVRGGEIPPTKENLLKAAEIANKVDSFGGDLKNAVDPYRNIEIVTKQKDQAIKDIESHKRQLFQQGDEDLSAGAEPFLSRTEKVYRNIFDADYPIAKLGYETGDETLYGGTRANRDMGSRRDVPVYQGTYKLYNAGDDLPHDPISRALNKNLHARGYADPEEVVFTGEGIRHILRGKWEISADNVAHFIDDPLTEAQFDDLSGLMLSKRLVEDVAPRKVDEEIHKHYLASLEDWERELRGAAKDNKLLRAELSNLERVRNHVKREIEFLKIHLKPEDVQRHKQHLEDLRVKYGDEGFRRLEERAKRFTEFERRHVLDRAEEIGLLSKDMKAKIIARNLHHTPIRFLMNSMGDPYRTFEDVSKGAKKVTWKERMKMRTQQGKEELGLQQLQHPTLKDAKYVNPIQEIIRRSHSATSFYERQRLANKIVAAYRNLVDNKKFYNPAPGTDPSMSALEQYLDTMDDFHFERVNSLPGGRQPENSIRIFNDGKVEFWRADPDLVEAVSGLSPQELSAGMKVLAGAAHALRLGATSTPKFFWRNIRRDPMTQFIFTEEGGIPFWDTAMGLMHYMKKGELWEEFVRSGMGHSTQSTLEADFKVLQELGYSSIMKGHSSILTESAKSFARGHPFRGMAHLGLESFRGIGQAGEAASRLGHFRRLKLMRDRKGVATKALKLFNDYTLGLERAWQNSRANRTRFLDEWKKFKNRDITYLDMLEAVREGSLDFHRMGKHVRTFNRVRAFTNAGLQDMDKLARVAKDRPFTTGIRLLTTITLPSLYYWNMWKDDEDYKNEPDYKRNLFWYIGRDKDGDWITFPKPFLPGVLFGTLAEKTAEYAYNTDPQGFEESMRGLFGSDEFGSFFRTALESSPAEIIGGAELMPQFGAPNVMNMMVSAAPDALQVAGQAFANKDIFRERQIVPQYMEGGSPRYQYNEQTSPFMVGLSKNTVGFSPTMGEWLVGEIFGGTGRLALDSADAITKALSGDLPKGAGVREIKHLLGITEKASSGFASNKVRKFYESRAEVDYHNETISAMKEKLKSGMLNKDEVAEYIKEHQKSVLYKKAFANASKKISSLAKSRTRVAASNMDDKKKKESLEKIDKAIEKIADAVNSSYLGKRK